MVYVGGSGKEETDGKTGKSECAFALQCTSSALQCTCLLWLLLVLECLMQVPLLLWAGKRAFLNLGVLEQL